MNKRNYTEEYFKIKLEKRERWLNFWMIVGKTLCAMILSLFVMIFPFSAGYELGLEGFVSAEQIVTVVICACTGVVFVTPLVYMALWMLKDDGE